MEITNRTALFICVIIFSLTACGGGDAGGTKTPPVQQAVDSDGDGIIDSLDAFPNDATESSDIDGDGVGDNTDAFPNDASETLDADNDGTGDNSDAFPNDPFESLDANNDLIGDKFGRLFENGIRAVHIGGNWGRNTDNINSPPNEYFDFLNRINANWVGISVALHYDDSLDSTVKRKYQNVDIPTFEDAALIGFIQKLKSKGFKVYLTLAFESGEAAENIMNPAPRWLLGDPNGASELKELNESNWPWDPNYQAHEQFVTDFWGSYTSQAVYFARIAETTGVDLLSIGTETERLFRSRSDSHWKTEFSTNIKSMVNSVREVYSGYVTYDMHYEATTNDYYDTGSKHLWQDTGMDIIGISAYFPLVAVPQTSVISVEECEVIWRNIFESYILPIRKNNPKIPIVFLEFGYVDSLNSPFNPASNEFDDKVFADLNSNNQDDGEEVQGNILKAFYNVRKEYPYAISGTFLWDNYIADDEDWSNSFGKLRGFPIRGKLAEDIVSKAYEEWEH